MLKIFKNLFSKKKNTIEDVGCIPMYVPIRFNGLIKINSKIYRGCYISEKYSRYICLPEGIARISPEAIIEFVKEEPLTNSGVIHNVECYDNDYATVLLNIE